MLSSHTYNRKSLNHREWLGNIISDLKKSGGFPLVRLTFDGNGKSYVTTSEPVLRLGHVLLSMYSLYKYMKWERQEPLCPITLGLWNFLE